MSEDTVTHQKDGAKNTVPGGKRPLWKKLPFLGKPVPVVGVIRLAGVIGASSVGRRGLSLADLVDPIERAFKLKHLSAVALQINSPGGSPVQSDLIATRIRQLADEKEVPVFAFCEDAAASGGYWLASAADEIFVRPASIVGSIGVISAGFGFKEAITKLGVERRVYTAGRNKSRLDPFEDEKPEDVERLKELQLDLHDHFIGYIKERRGAKLAADDDTLFNGDFWTGDKAVELGLADGLGDVRGTMRERFGEEVRLKPTVRPKGRLQRLLGLDTALPSGEDLAERVAGSVIDVATERLYWQRLGL